jgi:hypothetical protein
VAVTIRCCTHVTLSQLDRAQQCWSQVRPPLLQGLQQAPALLPGSRLQRRVFPAALQSRSLRVSASKLFVSTRRFRTSARPFRRSSKPRRCAKRPSITRRLAATWLGERLPDAKIDMTRPSKRQTLPHRRCSMAGGSTACKPSLCASRLSTKRMVSAVFSFFCSPVLYTDRSRRFSRRRRS